MLDKYLGHLGSIAGSIVAVIGLLWLIGEPALEKYTDERIDLYQQKRIEENSNKVKLRTLLSEKMEVADDEVHIELGKTYKQDKHIVRTLDSLERVITALKTSQANDHKDIALNYGDILDIQEKIATANQRHGIFN